MGLFSTNMVLRGEAISEDFQTVENESRDVLIYFNAIFMMV